MMQLVQDLRFAARQLRRSPGFALTAMLTLALGIGANTAIFSLLDQTLLRPLPVHDPQQLVLLEGTGKVWEGRTSGHGGDRESYFSYPMYRDLRNAGGPFSGLIATTTAPVGILRGDSSTVEDAEIVTGNYFQVLGVKPALGRLLSDADDTAPGANQVAVLSYDYWHDRLGADRSLIGQLVRVNAHPVTIIGVAAQNFRSAVWGQTPALFVPISMIAEIDPSQANAFTNHKDRWLNLVGRLRGETTAGAAEVQLAPLWHALRAEELKAFGTRSRSFTDDFVTNSRLRLLPGAHGLSYSRARLEEPLFVVMGMAVLILLIASVNVASLLLVRSAARVREFSVRYALGATARRVFAQLLLEGMLIGLLGGVLGIALAPLAIRVISNRLTAPGDVPIFSTGLDGRLLGFSLLVAIVVSVLFSLVPVWQLLRPDLVAALKQQRGNASTGQFNFRRVIVSLQVGLSVLLLFGAGLLVRTLENLRHVDVGFNTTHLVTFSIRPMLAGYTQDRIPGLHRQLLEALAAVPGVQSVGGTDSAELANSDSSTNVTVDGYTPPPDEDLDIGRMSITPDYFATLREPLVAGRPFTEADDLQHPPVVIVNQSFARHYFGRDSAAVGKRMARGGGTNLHWMEIVGVSRDAHHISVRDDVKMTDFTPLLQETKRGELSFYLRTANAPSSVFDDVRLAVRRIDPELALERIHTLDEQIDDNLNDERILGLLAVAFGGLATLLAGVGLYGVLAYSTAQRTQEIGIRMALGSSRLAVSWLVLADVIKLAGMGVLVALPCAFLLARTLRNQLYGVSTMDPLTLGSVVLLIGLVCLVAASVPARRAASIQPTEALRNE